ncbi:MAG TPA: sigma-70 family RNA polymerase sigma factor [Vicinamibacteria bacterium]|nr:sigma-70 family RNA polymerase sigma factor [Vicinamibacteria bacterium]
MQPSRARSSLSSGEARLKEEEVEPADDELVRAFVASRAEEPFRLLFRRHTPALLRLGQRLLGGDAAAAEDAVQEAWIRAVTRLPEFRFESMLRTWLCGFVVNRCREVLRSRGATAPVTAELVSEPTAAPADTARALDLERAVLGLADGYRAVFVLHDLVGYTHHEIAERLEIQEGTSKSQLFLARRALRQRLGGRPVREDRHEG